MNLHYLMNELYYQKRRTLTAILGLSIGIALLIILNALSMAYRQAAHAPLKEIGADITVQRPGDVPKDLAGAVFPCSAVTIRQSEVEKIQGLPGIRGVGKALLLWVFDPNRAWIVLGIEQNNTIGPAILRSSVTEGRFIEEGKSEALVEVAYARQFGVKLGDTISVADKKFPVVGFIDASRAAKIAVTNVYLPLADAQQKHVPVADGPGVQHVQHVHQGHSVPANGATPEVRGGAGGFVGPILLLALVPSVIKEAGRRVVGVGSGQAELFRNVIE